MRVIIFGFQIGVAAFVGYATFTFLCSVGAGILKSINRSIKEEKSDKVTKMPRKESK